MRKCEVPPEVAKNTCIIRKPSKKQPNMIGSKHIHGFQYKRMNSFAILGMAKDTEILGKDQNICGRHAQM
jgi:hypothetical protein